MVTKAWVRRSQTGNLMFLKEKAGDDAEILEGSSGGDD